MTQLYDDYNISSIVEYARRLEGHSLREMTDAISVEDFRKRKGSFGDAVQEEYFRIPRNSRPTPDFENAGLELKVTPLKRLKSGRIVSKERLVLGSIDFNAVVGETFETSHLMEKCRQLLLITYLWERDVDPLDYKFILADLWSIPQQDMEQIKRDWETVVRKIRDGRAEEISSSDTLYLEACTKAASSKDRRAQPYSTVLAKPRAWALKASYMTATMEELRAKQSQIPRSEYESRLSLLELVRTRFAPYFGKTQEQLAAHFGCNPKAKQITALITKRILGVEPDERIEEFVKANIKPKSLRLQRNGVPKESMSFPMMDFTEVATTPFEDSEFYGHVSAKYLFVVYREDATGSYRLSDVLLWQMPDEDLEMARSCYAEMQRNIREGHAEVSVHSSQNPVCHVRTHGRNGNDLMAQPFGPPVPKRSFWLNAGYLAKQIAMAEKEVDGS